METPWYEKYAKSFGVVIAIIVVVLLALWSMYEKVPTGNVGIRVYTYGSSKGIDYVPLSIGRHIVPPWQEFYKFPVYQQMREWNNTDRYDERFKVQTKEGMLSRLAVAVAFKLERAKVPYIFEEYRMGIEGITEGYIKNTIQQAFVDAAAIMSVEDLYGDKKIKFYLASSDTENIAAKMAIPSAMKVTIKDPSEEKVTIGIDMISYATHLATEKLKPKGVLIDYIVFTTPPDLPPNVVAALNLKIEANQKAQQRENEVAEAKAEADKKIAAAHGEAESTKKKAEAEAYAITSVGKAKADANALIAKSITPEIIQYTAVQNWKGETPTTLMLGKDGAIPFLNVPVK